MQGIFNRPPGQDFFYKVLAGSFITHLVILVIALFMYAPGGRRTFFAPVYTVTLVDPATTKKPAPAKEAQKKINKTEKKAPPTKEEAKAKPVKKETVKISAKVPDKPAPKEKADTVESALERIRERVNRKEEESLVSKRIEELREKNRMETQEVESSLKEIKKEIAMSASRSPEAEKAGSPPRPAGRVTMENLKAKYPEYYRIIHDRVWENWIYPLELGNRDVAIIVAIKISRDGSLLDHKLEKSSGSELFDQSLINAVIKAAPFPALPEGLEGEYLETGLRFCPGCTGE